MGDDLERPLRGYDHLQDCASKYRGGVAAPDPLPRRFVAMAGLPLLLIRVDTAHDLDGLAQVGAAATSSRPEAEACSTPAFDATPACAKGRIP
jgi:hypothetical protein